jgi:gag-polyprotein putative aspartyl protease
MRFQGLICAAVWAVGAATPALAACKILKLAELPVSEVDNRAFIEGRVNGHPVKMVVNTGSALTTIADTAAKQLGLNLEHLGGLRAFGATGERRLSATRIDSLQLGMLTGRGIMVAVMAANGPDEPAFVLGEDFLSRYTAEFDLGHDVIRLLKTDGCVPEQLVYWNKSYSMAELNYSGNDNYKIATTVLLDDTKVAAILSTGSRTSWSTQRTADHVGATKLADGAVPENWVGNFRSFSIGDDEKILNVRLRVADLYRRETRTDTGSHVDQPVERLPNMIIGYDFFKTHRMLVMYKEQKLLITYNGGPIFQVIGPVDTPAAVGE